jgi:hypothetical protein
VSFNHQPDLANRRYRTSTATSRRSFFRAK